MPSFPRPIYSDGGAYVATYNPATPIYPYLRHAHRSFAYRPYGVAAYGAYLYRPSARVIHVR